MTTEALPLPGAAPAAPHGLLERLLRPFSRVHAGEGATVLLLFANLFVLLVGYYILKTVREPLILVGGGAELASYAAGAQALVLMGFVPAYAWISSRVGRLRLIVALIVGFIVAIELFYVGGILSLPFVGFAFFVFVGIFSLSTIAQFWSYANDLFDRETGERLFPVVAIASTAGAPVGGWLAGTLYARGVGPYPLMQITAGLLVVHLGLYAAVERREASRRRAVHHVAPAPLAGPGGFTLILKSRYLTLFALLLLLLNWVNTNGEYILRHAVTEMVAATGRAVHDQQVMAGAFFASYVFWTAIVALVLQSFVVSRLVRYLGVAGAVLALPLVSLGAYASIAVGASLVLVRLAKIAENATEYSAMNTGRQLLWLPTRREEKYKAKQATDTFFVRSGDVVSALTVFAVTAVLHLSVRAFALLNLAVIAAWLVVTVLLLRRHRGLCTTCD